MSHKPSILVAVFSHPVARSNVDVVEVPFRGQTINELRTQMRLPANDICIVDNKQDGQIKNGSKVVFAPAAAWPALWELVRGIAWAALITVGVYYITRGLFDQPLPEKKDKPETQSFGWEPFTKRQEGIPKPVSYGTNMHYGNIVAKWTDVDDSGSEILYMILDYGRGPIKGRGANIVYIDDQPAGNYPGLSIQDRTGTLNQTCMTGFDKHKNEYRTRGYEVTNAGGAITWTTPNKNFNDIEYTLEWVRGLWYYTKMGDQVEHGIGVKVEISERGLSSWTTLMNTTVSGNQMSPIYKAYHVNTQVPGTVERGKQYDLRFSKTTADKGISRYGDDLAVRTIREVIDVAFTRPGRALLGIIALATKRLSGSFNVKWIADGKLVNVFNGTFWSIVFTRIRAWIYLDEITQPVISGDGGANPWTIERYEALSPTRVDTAFIYEWAEWCSQQVDDGNGGTEDRMTCDIICDYETDVWRLSYEIAQIGRMYPYWQGHTLTGWIDTVTDEPIDLITFDCVMARSWKSGYAGYGEMAGCAVIFYKDYLHGYERKGYPIPNENAGTYTRPEQIEGVGVDRQSLAIRVGNHVMQRNALIKNVNSVRMFKDALRYRLGRVVRLQATVPNWGQTFRVVQATSSNTMELDRIINASAGELLFVKSYDDINQEVSLDTYTVQSTVGKVVTIAETWLVTPDVNNICAIGKDGDIKLRRIIKMKHTEDNYIDVDLETYDTDLFNSDGLPLYIDNPDYAWPAPSTQLLRPLTVEQVREIVHQMLPNRPDIEIPWWSNLDWSGDSVDTVTWAKRDATEPIYFRYRGVSYEITPDTTTDEFIYWDPNFTTQFRTTNDGDVALAPGMWLMCINRAGVPFPANAVQLLHAAILLAGTIRAKHYLELRQTFVYNSEDSLDNSKSFTIPFKIVSEMTAIVSVKLSFRIMSYRAYSTAASSGGASTSGSGGGQTSSAGGAQTSSQGGSWITADTSTVDPGDTNDADLGTHYHEMPSHSHGVNGDTNTTDCGGTTHGHSIDEYDCDTTSVDPGNTYNRYLGLHNHTMPTHKHTIGQIQHTHTVDDHTHTVSNHTHTTPNHVHGVTYGIHEETNSPQIHYHIDNGAGFGGPSATYTADQIDLSIGGSIAGSGWKAIRFDSELAGANGRLRLFVIIECKLDVTA